MVQRARTESWRGDTRLDERPTIMTRLVTDLSGTMVGGLETLGSATAKLSFSLTSWRARRTSVPRSKIKVIEERPGTDEECMDCRNGVLLSSSSRLRVINSSTSEAE